MTVNLSASLLARLLNLAKQRGEDYSLLLNRFAMERLLCRLGASPYADQFLLKGALLFALWYDAPHRPTRDVDLLGYGLDDAQHLIAVFSEVAAMDMPDGVLFDLASVRASAIREDNTYGGTRIQLMAHIGSTRCTLQIDVGFGDAVTPEPQTVNFPVLLPDFLAPTLKVYPVYTVIAEKYHAMVVLDLANSRMKDFYDVATIARRTALTGATLATAIEATFKRRSTTLPINRPVALTSTFSENSAKLRQWNAFLTRNHMPFCSLSETVSLLEQCLWHPTEVALARATPMQWKPGIARWE